MEDLLKLVKIGEPWQIPTERLIRLNGNYRRGRVVTERIQSALKARGLVCTPAIDVADYYGNVVISDPRDEGGAVDDVVSLPISAFPSTLPELVYAGPEMSAEKAVTLMTLNDISQLPVLANGGKTLKGTVTWRSLARFRGSDLASAKVVDVMADPGHVAESSDDFLNLVDVIVKQEFVYYRDHDGRVVGIVTVSDLAGAFDETAGVYIQLGEVENRLRILLDRCPLPELKSHLAPNRRNMTNFRGAQDMQFNEYLNALNDDAIWQRIDAGFDRSLMVSLLETVRDSRNKVMHFNSGMEERDREAVAKSLRLLREIPL